MRQRSLPGFLLLALLASLTWAAVPAATDDVYKTKRASRDGTGKFYMSREIAQVMGHLGAGWLERPSREREERTDLLLSSLELQPGDVVADIGAGTGYFSLPMARRVGDPPDQAMGCSMQGNRIVTALSFQQKILNRHRSGKPDREHPVHILEPAVPHPAVHAARQLQYAPPAVMDGVLMMNKFLLPVAGERYILHADLLQVTAFLHGPPLCRSHGSMNRLPEGQRVAVDPFNLMEFVDFNTFLDDGCPGRLRGVGSNRRGHGFG